MQEAYSIQSFLDAYPIGRTTLYAAWKQGRGPRRVKIGRRVLIPRQAADDWIAGLLDEEEGGQ